MRGRVAVAARDRHARLREPELQTDDVHDPLILMIRRPEGDAVLAAITLERDRHLFGHHVEERPLLTQCRNDVIDGRERALGERDLPTVLPQHVERLRARDFVNKM